ncbi:hypothetical protein K502DRAFT_325487 [Neoconidiobolus thromboides FSU 785]|nr:hypothetical protein K502DRAFT_325487 [Neoconidiobolus thromboides FSU 785]
MNQTIEKQRQLYQEIEIIEQAIVDQYHQKTKTYKEKLQLEQQVNLYLTSIQSRGEKLNSLYHDETVKREIEEIGTGDFGLFYKKVKNIRDGYQNKPTLLVEPVGLNLLAAIGRADIEKDLFSGEEKDGKYLDLIQCFDLFFNLQINDKGYLEYLEGLNEFDKIPLAKKETKYQEYLNTLISYLESYFIRARPLFDYLGLKKKGEEELNNLWSEGKVVGWPMAGKNELFCNACNKSFTNEAVYQNHLTGKKHIKNQKLLENNEEQRDNSSNDNNDPKFKMACMEHVVKVYLEELKEILEDTKLNIERKQSLTEREREIEQQEAAESESEKGGSDTDEDDERIYNPLKLPLGWDGKPIPYWLYKLHGLGVEYPCEICGNFVYMGRKAFERHFQEWRHAHGMRCLGIPNTKHFNEITSIQDAYSLWEKLKTKAKVEIQDTETLEEFEDDHGHVYNKKTYLDLKRQGII